MPIDSRLCYSPSAVHQVKFEIPLGNVSSRAGKCESEIAVSKRPGIIAIECSTAKEEVGVPAFVARRI